MLGRQERTKGEKKKGRDGGRNLQLLKNGGNWEWVKNNTKSADLGYLLCISTRIGIQEANTKTGTEVHKIYWGKTSVEKTEGSRESIWLDTVWPTQEGRQEPQSAGSLWDGNVHGPNEVLQGHQESLNHHPSEESHIWGISKDSICLLQYLSHPSGAAQWKASSQDKRLNKFQAPTLQSILFLTSGNLWGAFSWTHTLSLLFAYPHVIPLSSASIRRPHAPLLCSAQSLRGPSPLNFQSIFLYILRVLSHICTPPISHYFLTTLSSSHCECWMQHALVQNPWKLF